MNKGLIGGVAAGAVVLAAIVAAFAVFGGGKPGAQVDAFVARLDLPPEVTVDYGHAAGAGISDDITVSDLRVRGGDAAGGELTAEQVVLGQLAGRDWPTRIEASGLVAGDAGGRVRIAKLSATGIDPRTRMPSQARIEGIAGASSMTGEITVERVELRDLDAANEVPERVDLAIRGIEAALDDARSPVAMAIGSLGYDRLRVDLDYAYAYDRAEETMRIDGVRLAALDMGALTVTALLGGVTPEALTDPEAAAALDSEATLRRLELRYEDASLADRLLEMAARDEGLSTEEMRGQLIEAIQVEVRTATDQLTKEVLRAIETFLAEPGTIRIVAEPPEPVKLAALEDLNDDPDAVRALLGLRVEAQ